MPREKKLILASSSRFRQQQLQQLNIPFDAVKPDFDETPLSAETAPQTALRLASTTDVTLSEWSASDILQCTYGTECC